MAAAHTLAELVSQADLEQGSLYPALPRIREVSAPSPRRWPRSPINAASPTGQAPKDLLAFVQSQMFDPRY